MARNKLRPEDPGYAVCADIAMAVRFMRAAVGHYRLKPLDFEMLSWLLAVSGLSIECAGAALESLRVNTRGLR